MWRSDRLSIPVPQAVGPGWSAWLWALAKPSNQGQPGTTRDNPPGTISMCSTVLIVPPPPARDSLASEWPPRLEKEPGALQARKKIAEIKERPRLSSVDDLLLLLRPVVERQGSPEGGKVNYDTFEIYRSRWGPHIAVPDELSLLSLPLLSALLPQRRSFSAPSKMFLNEGGGGGKESRWAVFPLRLLRARELHHPQLRVSAIHNIL